MSDEHPQWGIKLPIPSQLCSCSPTQKKRVASALTHTTRTGENWLFVFWFPYLHDSPKRGSSLSTASRMLAQPSMKPLCAYKPSWFWIFTNFSNDYKLLYKVLTHVCSKWHAIYHVPCAAPKPNGRHTSNNVHHSAYFHDDTKLSFWWVRNDQILHVHPREGKSNPFKHTSVRDYTKLSGLCYSTSLRMDPIYLYSWKLWMKQ